MSKYRILAKRHDKSHMDRVIRRIPDQIAYALADDDVPTPSQPYDRCVVLGMGGSALPADVIRDAFFDGVSTGSLVNWRRYGMPRAAGDEKTLYIASSFSGTTEETLDGLDHLIQQGYAGDTMVIAAHGDLIDVAKKHLLKFVRLPADEREPSGFQPRSATGYFVAYLVRILEAAGILHDAIEELRAVPAFLRKAANRIRAEAEPAAHWLFKRRIPVILTDDCYERSVGRIFTIKLFENAKRPALHGSLPEANHNLMIGLSRPLGNKGRVAEYGLLYVSDPDSDPRVHARFNVMREIFKDPLYSHVDMRSWEIPGATRIQKIFAALIFADWCSYTLALLDGEDPTPVDLVEQFKRKLAGGPARRSAASSVTQRAAPSRSARRQSR